jgi:hypothetical protein
MRTTHILNNNTWVDLLVRRSVYGNGMYVLQRNVCLFFFLFIVIPPSFRIGTNITVSKLFRPRTKPPQGFKHFRWISFSAVRPAIIYIIHGKSRRPTRVGQFLFVYDGHGSALRTERLLFFRSHSRSNRLANCVARVIVLRMFMYDPRIAARFAITFGRSVDRIRTHVHACDSIKTVQSLC